MKKTIWIRLLLTLLALILFFGGLLFYRLNDKKPYDYSSYYVPKQKIKIPEIEVQTKEEEESELSLELLRKTNPDIVGIIEFPDRIIYEPFVQAKDNEQYLRRNIEGNYAAAGTPFISGGSDLNATNVVIYGHSGGRYAVVFTPLMNYLEKDFYDLHPGFVLHTLQGDRQYTIFAVLNVDPKDRNDTLEFTRSSWRKEADYSAFLTDMKKRSLYDTKVKVSSQDRIVTFVTCDTRDISKRIVVIAKEGR